MSTRLNKFTRFFSVFLLLVCVGCGLCWTNDNPYPVIPSYETITYEDCYKSLSHSPEFNVTLLADICDYCDRNYNVVCYLRLGTILTTEDGYTVLGTHRYSGYEDTHTIMIYSHETSYNGLGIDYTIAHEYGHVLYTTHQDFYDSYADMLVANQRWLASSPYMEDNTTELVAQAFAMYISGYALPDEVTDMVEEALVQMNIALG